MKGYSVLSNDLSSLIVVLQRACSSLPLSTTQPINDQWFLISLSIAHPTIQCWKYMVWFKIKKSIPERFFGRFVIERIPNSPKVHLIAIHPGFVFIFMVSPCCSIKITAWSGKILSVSPVSFPRSFVLSTLKSRCSGSSVVFIKTSSYVFACSSWLLFIFHVNKT